MYDILSTNFDTYKINKSLSELLLNVPFDYRNQICLTNKPGCNDPYYKGVGSLYHNDGIRKQIEHIDKESDYTEFNKNLYNSYFYHIYNCWTGDYGLKLGRIRLMKLNKKCCLSWHVDTDKRIHLPIITDEKCKVVIDDHAFHLPANGNSFIVDTTLPHTVFNGSMNTERVHLVGTIL
jgi:hypothetical protein